MLKIGLLGVGHLGLIHLKCIKNISEYRLVGFYDPDEERAKKVAVEHDVRRYDSITELIDDSDVVDIVTPTVSHFDLAKEALKKAKHLFIEKPIAANVQEGEELLKLAEEANVMVQVGHVERFNPAFKEALPVINKPMFIEAHRLGEYNPRGTDVPVVLDLMIHDIDIVLSVIKANVRRIFASGVPVISDTPDIANARLEFDNGAVANLTASRISLKNMRKMRFFQPNAYITVDFLDKKTEIVRLEELDEMPDNPFAMVLDPGKNGKKRQLIFEKPDVRQTNAIEEELRSLYRSVTGNQPVMVPVSDGFNALSIAHQIVEKINFALQ